MKLAPKKKDLIHLQNCYKRELILPIHIYAFSCRCSNHKTIEYMVAWQTFDRNSHEHKKNIRNEIQKVEPRVVTKHR